MSSMLTAYRPTADTYGIKSSRIPSRTPSYNRSLSYEGTAGKSGRTSPFTGGLPTPPGNKNMTGVSLGPSLGSYQPSRAYEPNRLAGHNVSSRIPSRQPENPYQLPPPQQQQQPLQPHYRDTSTPPFSRVPTQPLGRIPSQQQYDSRTSQGQDYSLQQAEKSTTNMIAVHLQIPESVNKSKGSLAEFAAEITCLFWFESAGTLQYAEGLPIESPVDRGLVSDATPSIGFRKWVTTIISTTQVAKNVILLALMFIYRLKKFNPSVSGKRGSEFRLLTIALMLGNKFLDDNTYTNKTWAEVSGISVTEIHIMEVEFLSNMRYALYASESEWMEWKARLGRFGSFYEKASKVHSPVEAAKIGTPTTPTLQGSPHKLHSPPSSHNRTIPSYGNASSSTQNLYPTLANPTSNIPSLPRSPLRHQRIPSIENGERKRSLDYGSDLPPAKRLYSIQHQPSTGQLGGILTPNSYSSTGPEPGQIPSTHFKDSSENSNVHGLPRLPMPRIPAMNAHSQPISLPMSTGRAMSTVYPNVSTPASTASWSQPVTPLSAVPPSIYQNPIPNLGDGSRSHSNYGSTHTSPTGYGTNTPVLPGLSPSHFLTNRSSPYRPVRHVNTLLIPPPSAALTNPNRNIAQDQIRYQPLSKVMTEPRTGPVPYYQNQDAWHQNNNLTPTIPQQYHYQP